MMVQTLITSTFQLFFCFLTRITNWPTLACLCPRETLDWAKHSNQSLIFVKLDFTKVYDKVGWEFLFETLKKMSIATDFIIIIRLLFKDTEHAIYVNGNITKTF
jgi:hypothetical protein